VVRGSERKGGRLLKVSKESRCQGKKGLYELEVKNIDETKRGASGENELFSTGKSQRRR